ncbi:beta-ribofuranosylaminobenzene 5'-phosphate synthase [Methanobrevibacter sp. DSM 116169]|uniref:beta-ribofuranosylaminobenzene 5'-phosphate synthase n=1 Tax=Methanobrevibacter sp. DSM 116169 TaxID=3242727 RepID=UPI0038FCD47E
MYIETPSRLHMGLIDLNGSYGRTDGGIGLTIEKPNFKLYSEEAEKGITIDFCDSIDNDTIKKECITKIKSAAEKTINHFNIESGFYFKVDDAFYPHAGFGSGTQMGLATSKLITEFYGISADAVELGKITGRGGTSGIGIFTFENGGFILDGGHSLKEKDTFLPSAASVANPPQLIGRYEFPEEWDVLIAIPTGDMSVSGKKEIDIFQEYCPVDKNEVEKMSHLILMNLIPFLLEKDIEAFGKSIDVIQTLGFKKIEVNLQSEHVKNLMDKMKDFGAYGVGMSSFGPTLFSVFDKNNKSIVKETKDYLGDDGIVYTTKAQNHGHRIYK